MTDAPKPREAGSSAQSEQPQPLKPPHLREMERRVQIGETVTRLSENLDRSTNQEAFTREVATFGNEDAHLLLPHLKDVLVDPNQPFHGASRSFAQIYRATATDSMRDMNTGIDATRSLLNQDNAVGNGSTQVAETLIRQVYDHRKKEGNLGTTVKGDSRMDEVGKQLQKLLGEYKKGGGYIGREEDRKVKVGTELTRRRLLQALAMTGTDDARKFISDRKNYDVQGMLGDEAVKLAFDATRDPSVLKDVYEQQYDITSPLDQSDIPTAQDDATESADKIDDVREEIQAIAEEPKDEPSEPDNITDMAAARDRKETEHASHRITSETSNYDSDWVSYEVPDAKALYNFITGPKNTEMTDMKVVSGPEIEPTGVDKNPIIYYENRPGSDKRMVLEISLPRSLQGYDFKGSHLQPFMEAYKKDVQDTLNPSINIRTDRYNNKLLRVPDSGQGADGIADISQNKMKIYLDNLGDHIGDRAADSLENFKIAMENGLRIYRDFTTEALKTTISKDTKSSSIKSIDLKLVPNWQERQQTENLPQAS